MLVSEINSDPKVCRLSINATWNELQVGYVRISFSPSLLTSMTPLTDDIDNFYFSVLSYFDFCSCKLVRVSKPFFVLKNTVVRLAVLDQISTNRKRRNDLGISHNSIDIIGMGVRLYTSLLYGFAGIRAWRVKLL